MNQPTNQTPQSEKEVSPSTKSRPGRISGYIINIAINAAMLYVASNLLRWEAQFILPSWSDVLGVIKFSFWLNIAAYATFIFYDGRGYYYLARTAMDAVSLYVTYRLIVVFPFDFDGFYHQKWLNDVFPYLLWLCLFGLAIAMIVRTVRLVAGKNIYL